MVLMMKARTIAAYPYAQKTLKSDGNVLAGDGGDAILCLPDCLLGIVLTLFTRSFCSLLLFFLSLSSQISHFKRAHLIQQDCLTMC